MGRDVFSVLSSPTLKQNYCIRTYNVHFDFQEIMRNQKLKGQILNIFDTSFPTTLYLSHSFKCKDVSSYSVSNIGY